MSEENCKGCKAGRADGPEINGEDYFKAKYGRLPQIGDIEDGWAYERCAGCGHPGWIDVRDYFDWLFRNIAAYCEECRANGVNNG